VPIYICKNCGNLTEAEDVTGLKCDNCGAPLDTTQTKDKVPSPQSPTATQPDQQTRTPSTPSTKIEQSPPKNTKVDEEPPIIEDKPTDQPERTLPQKPIELPKSEPSIPPSPSPAIAGPVSSQTHVFSDSNHEILEIYDNKNLVACPQCGYGCDPQWNSCPICQTQFSEQQNLQKIDETEFTFDEEKMKQRLIPCPKCQYYCDPAWEQCPICQSPLPKPKES